MVVAKIHTVVAAGAMVRHFIFDNLSKCKIVNDYLPGGGGGYGGKMQMVIPMMMMDMGGYGMGGGSYGGGGGGSSYGGEMAIKLMF